jgi:hypothetical protein
MKLIGIPLRRPNFAEVTAAAVMATGLWLAGVALARTLHLEMSRIDAGALLLVLAWGCVSARMGIRVGAGQRHLLVNLVVSAVLLVTYQALCAAWLLGR